VGEVVVHYVEHGTGRPVLVLHGAGVDHREAEACFEPALDGVAGLRRIYPDLPEWAGQSLPKRCAAPTTSSTRCSTSPTRSAAGRVPPHRSLGGRVLRAGDGREAPGAGRRSGARLPVVAGTARRPGAPRRRRIGWIGDDVFRSYFVIHTPEMLERYERYVAPAAALVDQAALERIGERWALTPITTRRTPVRQCRGGAAGLDGRVCRRSTSSTTTRTPRSRCSTARDMPCPTSSRNSCERSSPSGSRAPGVPSRWAPVRSRS
jgi:hypothetical protein